MSCKMRGAHALLLGVSLTALMLGSADTHAQTAQQAGGATAIPEIAISSEKVEGLTTYDASEL